MNKRLLILPLLALGGQAMAQTDVTVNLKEKAVDSLIVTVSEEGSAKEIRKFTVAAKGGKAKFQLDETTPHAIYLEAVPSKKWNSFMLIPGAKIKVGGTLDDLKVSGHDFYKDEAAYNASLKDLKAKSQDFDKRIRELQEKGDSKAAEKLFREELLATYQQMQDKAEEFITTHPGSDYSVYLATVRWQGEDRQKQLAKLVDAGENSIMKSFKDAVIANEKKQQEEADRRKKEREEQMTRMQGTDAPEFALPSLDGTPLSISSLKGKVTVIDFWGKWCYWCMKGMPDMKKYYEKYAGKLEILGVNYGDTEDVWKKTVEENELTWKHVRMDRANKEQTAILQLYGVSGFPTKVILSAEGKIIKVVVGEDPAFYTLIDELLEE